jgi:hypothetical protein
MDSGHTWEARFKQEIHQADIARLAGNEGKARVCARRAAGIVANQFLLRQGIESSKLSATVNLKAVLEISDLPPEMHEVITHFLIHVTPDHQLPIKADLIIEARWLAKELMAWNT